MLSDDLAPDGQIWFDPCTGKTSYDRVGGKANQEGWSALEWSGCVLVELRSLVVDPRTGLVTDAVAVRESNIPNLLATREIIDEYNSSSDARREASSAHRSTEHWPPALKESDSKDQPDPSAQVPTL